MKKGLHSHHVDEYPTLLRWCKRMGVLRSAQRRFQYHQGRVRVVNNQRDASIDLGRLVLGRDISNATKAHMPLRELDQDNWAVSLEKAKEIRGGRTVRPVSRVLECIDITEDGPCSGPKRGWWRRKVK